MTLTTTPAARVPARGARKSPLRTATMTALADAVGEPAAADILLAAGRRPGGPVTAPELRRMQISEFADWLRSRTNRNKRPFQEASIAAYTDAARALDRWMTAQDIDGDFTAGDTAMLNRFLPAGSASTARRGEHPAAQPAAPVHVAGGGLRAPAPLHRGAAPVRPAEEAAVHPGAGVHPRPARGHRRRPGPRLRGRAGPRHDPDAHRGHPPRWNCSSMELPDLSSDLIARPFVRVVPLKSARAFSEGRLVLLAAADVPGRGGLPAGTPLAPARRLLTGCGWAPATAASSARVRAVPQDAHPARRRGRVWAGGDPAPVPAHSLRLMTVLRLAPEPCGSCDFRLRRAVSCFYGSGS